MDYCGLEAGLALEINAAVAELAARGLRALAGEKFSLSPFFRYRCLIAVPLVASKRGGEDWKFLGLITLRDSLRNDAKEFIGGLKQLGVQASKIFFFCFLFLLLMIDMGQPKMITGDGIEIAKETCKLIGLSGKVLSRQELLAHVASRYFRAVVAFAFVLSFYLQQLRLFSCGRFLASFPRRQIQRRRSVAAREQNCWHDW